MARRWALAVLLCMPAIAAETDTVDAALKRMYQFDFPASQDILTRVISQHPQDPLPYAFRASAYLFYELDRMSILESEFFTDDKRIADKRKKLDPDPLIREKFLKAVHDAETRADDALKANPNNREALFAMCIAQGVSTDYMAFVEKRQIASLSVAKRSNSYAQQLLRLDPKFYDAYLSAGITEYMVGSLPFFVRWFVKFDNVAGSKEKGIQNLQTAAREGRYFRPMAKILLCLVALREKRQQDARVMLAELARDYPSNPLFRSELAKLTPKIGASAN